jgi:hypothetical protein
MKTIAESIRMIERRFDIFPAKFDWRGRVYRVDAVNECKTITDTRGVPAAFHYWVRCDDQRFHLEEIVPSGHWSVHHD